MLEKNDYENIGNELILQPNLILSIIDDKEKKPILATSGRNGYETNYKIFNLIFSSIFHFGEIMLGESLNISENKEDIDLTFIEKYLNFDKCYEIVRVIGGGNTVTLLYILHNYYLCVNVSINCMYFYTVECTR